MPRLSVIIITNNEEENLPRCLKSVSFADEIILNDSGSSDRTLEIAREHGCKIIENKFTGFGAAKQSALDQATGEWVLSIDADEEVDDALREAIKGAIRKANKDTNNQANASSSHSAFQINRQSQFLGRWINHSGWYPDHITRLFRREQARFTDSVVHEKVIVDGTIGRLEGRLLHYTDPTLTHYFHKLNHYTSLSAQSLMKEGKRFRIHYLLIKPWAIFIKMYFLKQGFRDGIHGLILALLSSVHVMVKYAKLWELQRR
jgi:glycosyltransferase involved in cell wall biosynthesis